MCNLKRVVRTKFDNASFLILNSLISMSNPETENFAFYNTARADC